MRLWDFRLSHAGEQKGGFTAALTQNVCFLISDFFFFLFRAVLSLCLSCDVHQSLLLFNTDTKITKFRHQVVSIWFGLVPYLYCTDGYYSADTLFFFFFFFVIFDSWGFSKIGLALARETHNPFILSRWLWTTFGNVNNSLALSFFFFCISLLAAQLE